MSSSTEVNIPNASATVAPHKPKRPSPPTDGSSFCFVCTLNGLGPAERDELVQIFKDHKPRAESAGASKLSVFSSVENYKVQIIEVYEGPDAEKKFHAVHAHDGFQEGHERVKLLHNNVDGLFFRQEI